MLPSEEKKKYIRYSSKYSLRFDENALKFCLNEEPTSDQTQYTYFCDEPTDVLIKSQENSQHTTTLDLLDEYQIFPVTEFQQDRGNFLLSFFSKDIIL